MVKRPKDPQHWYSEANWKVVCTPTTVEIVDGKGRVIAEIRCGIREHYGNATLMAAGPLMNINLMACMGTLETIMDECDLPPMLQEMAQSAAGLARYAIRISQGMDHFEARKDLKAHGYGKVKPGPDKPDSEH